MALSQVNVFVPGRVCLLGEHTDWAVLHAGKFPSEPIEKGHCLVYGTNCGIHATASSSEVEAETLPPTFTFRGMMAHPPSEMHFTVVRDAGGHASYEVSQHDDQLRSELIVPLSPSLQCLETIARSGTFFSYVAGSALVMFQRFSTQLAGMSYAIVNDRTDLPVGKGLSSSAAVCVLVVRSLSQLAKIPLTVEEEMELAYLGERCTPSKCGRMDQCVAYGVAPVSMLFEGEHVQCERIELPSSTSFYFVVADMNRSKDTQRILSELGNCFELNEPVDPEVARHGRHFLGVLSASFAKAAMTALMNGCAETLGRIFTEYQHSFDAHLQPVCPTQLTSPRLHQLLERQDIQRLTFGGKGVGSQGDGSIQFVCRGKEEQDAVMAILEREGCHSFKFTLS